MGKYNIIYADPPWQYKAWVDKGEGIASRHYDTMGSDDIKKLSVDNLAANDCALFMWATYPCLPEALDVIKAWGFTYKTVAFTWVKRNKKNGNFFFGLGHWTRANAEICLLATKGKPKRISNKVFQIVDTPLQEHSKKPDVVRERIVELMGDLPRIELFARQRVSGWDAWGDEV